MRPRRPRRDERGAAVVVGLSLVAILVLVALAGVGTAAIVLAHRRVQVAADLAALAAAGALQWGGDPCGAAGEIAGRHATALTRCRVEGSSVLVATTIVLPALLGGREVRARARAGPVGLAPVRGLRK